MSVLKLSKVIARPKNIFLSVFSIGLVLFGLSYFTRSFAVGTMIFSDDFEVANKWSTFSGSSAAERKTTDGSFVVGLNGSKGFLFKGASSSDPDDGEERSISTHGYKTLTVTYSRATSGLSGAASFSAQYSLDDGSFVTLETITANQSHASASFTIDNSARKTKLVLRFFVNGSDTGNKAAVDSLKVYGEDAPLFYDGFESNNFTTGGWTIGNTPTITNTNNDANIWTDNNITINGHAAEIDGSTAVNPDDSITKSFSTAGYQNIYVRYARRTSSVESDDTLKAMYSVDGGGSWTNFETISSNISYGSVVYGPLSGANDNPNFKIKFEMNANASNDNFYLDDVVIWGEPVPTPTPSPIPTDTPTPTPTPSESPTPTPTPEPSAVVSGLKFSDRNLNGIINDNEPVLSGWLIKLYNFLGDFIASTSTDENGLYQFSQLASGQYQLREEMQTNWEAILPASGSQRVTLTDGLQLNNIHFANVQYYPTLGLKVVPLNGSGNSASEFKILNQTVMSFEGQSGTSQITVPAGTTITTSSGEEVSIDLLTGSALSPSSLSGLGSGVVADGAFQWGISNLGLIFDTPITLSIFVGSGLNGQTLSVTRSVSGSGDWTNDGIVAPATCVVAEGLCVFQATKASYYASTHTSESSSNGGGGSGGGGGGGGVGEFLNGPLANNNEGSVAGVTATASPTPKPVILTPIIVSSNSKSLVPPSPTPTESVIPETSPSENPTPSAEPSVQRASLLGNIGNIFGLGTDNWLVALVVMCVLAFGTSWLIKRKLKK